MDNQREHEVAQGLREGNTDAWRTLYEAYAERVWLAVARRMGPELPDVADVVQEIFLAAARSAATYDAARGSLWGWLSGITRRHVALYYRRQRRHQRLRSSVGRPGVDNHRVLQWLEGREDMPTDALATAELADSVRTALGSLPADYETLLTAKYLDGVTVEQLAGHRNCSSTAVRSKLARARRAFRRAFRTMSSHSADSQARGHDPS
jgi:RNA polymerase sigma-70 factor (ECF subfamily)